MNWREILKKMGLNVHDLHPVTVQKLENASALCERAGGSLCSRQVIASIIVNQEPNLNIEERE